MILWRIGCLWFSVAALSPLALFFAAALLVFLAGAGTPDWTRLRPDWPWVGGQLLASLAYGLGEEPGWRGFALSRLQEDRTPLRATTWLALGWGVWHIPAFFHRYHLGGAGDVVGFFVGLYAGTIWLTFLYNRTQGSVFAVMVWHTVWNAVNQVAIVVSAPVLATMSVLVVAMAIIVVWRWVR